MPVRVYIAAAREADIRKAQSVQAQPARVIPQIDCYRYAPSFNPAVECSIALIRAGVSRDRIIEKYGRFVHGEAYGRISGSLGPNSLSAERP